LSDRYNYLIVVLEKDLKDEDAQPLLEAIQCLRGVLSVTPNVNDPDDWMAQERVRAELSEKLWRVLREGK
jgi:hypothetical protein